MARAWAIVVIAALHQDRLLVHIRHRAGIDLRRFGLAAQLQRPDRQDPRLRLRGEHVEAGIAQQNLACLGHRGQARGGIHRIAVNVVLMREETAHVHPAMHR